MSDKEQVFGDDPSPSAEPTPETTPNEGLGEFVGEGKKYATSEEALASVPHAQKHIAKLEKEAEELREQLSRASSIEEALARIEASSKDSMEDGTDSPHISHEDVARAARQAVEEVDAAKAARSNLGKVKQKAVELFGASAEDKAALIATKLGMSAQEMRRLAETAPEAAIRLLTDNTTVEVPDATPTSGKQTVSSEALNAKPDAAGVEGTYAYYEKLRKENPKRYFQSSVQKEMHEKAAADPDKFFGRS